MKPTKKHEKTNKTGAFQKTFKLTKKIDVDNVTCKTPSTYFST